MSASRAALAFVLLFSIASTSADEFTSPNVVHLTGKNYDDLIMDGKVYFVKFYAPWCGHCKRLADTWKQLGDNFKGSSKIAIAHVDCTTDRDVCTTADVKGYPTLKVMYKGEEIKPYKGQREYAALKTFITDAANEVLTEV